MLVVLGPQFSASESELAALADATGLLVYDLRSRLRPGAWGVVRALADEDQAVQLVEELRRRGFAAVAIDAGVGQDTSRRVVYVRGADMQADGITLKLSERVMTIPYGALLAVVRGEVHMGRSPQAMSLGGGSRGTSTSGPFRSPTTGSAEVFREPKPQLVHEVFAAADIHFATVTWVARVDAREFEFPRFIPESPSFAERLDCFVDMLAERSGVHVDRHIRTSSLSSHTVRAPRFTTPGGGLPPMSRRSVYTTDEHFDAYSRMVAEAERQLRIFGQ